MLRAIVIHGNEKTRDLGSLLQIARVESRRRERADKNPCIRSLIFDPVTEVWIAIYECDVQKPGAAEKMKH